MYIRLSLHKYQVVSHYWGGVFHGLTSEPDIVEILPEGIEANKNVNEKRHLLQDHITYEYYYDCGTITRDRVQKALRLFEEVPLGETNGYDNDEDHYHGKLFDEHGKFVASILDPDTLIHHLEVVLEMATEVNKSATVEKEKKGDTKVALLEDKIKELTKQNNALVDRIALVENKLNELTHHLNELCFVSSSSKAKPDDKKAHKEIKSFSPGAVTQHDKARLKEGLKYTARGRAQTIKAGIRQSEVQNDKKSTPFKSGGKH